MLRAEVLADGSVGHNSACGLLLEVRQCWGMFVVRSRSLLLMDFLQCGCRIAQKLNWQLGSKNSGPPFWLSYNASTYHSAGEGATQDDRGVGESSHLGSDQSLDYLLYMGDHTTQLYGDYSKPIYGSL